MLGYVSGELIGKSVETLLPIDLRLRHPALRESFFAESIPRPMNSSRAVVALRSDGKAVHVIIALSKFFKEQCAFVMAQLFLCEEEMFKK